MSGFPCWHIYKVISWKADVLHCFSMHEHRAAGPATVSLYFSNSTQKWHCLLFPVLLPSPFHCSWSSHLCYNSSPAQISHLSWMLTKKTLKNLQSYIITGGKKKKKKVLLHNHSMASVFTFFTHKPQVLDERNQLCSPHFLKKEILIVLSTYSEVRYPVTLTVKFLNSWLPWYVIWT